MSKGMIVLTAELFNAELHDNKINNGRRPHCRDFCPWRQPMAQVSKCPSTNLLELNSVLTDACRISIIVVYNLRYIYSTFI